MLFCSTFLLMIGNVVRATSFSGDNSECPLSSERTQGRNISKSLWHTPSRNFLSIMPRMLDNSFFNKNFLHFYFILQDSVEIKKKKSVKSYLIFYFNIFEYIVGFTVSSQRLTLYTSFINFRFQTFIGLHSTE